LEQEKLTPSALVLAIDRLFTLAPPEKVSNAEVASRIVGHILEAGKKIRAK